MKTFIINLFLLPALIAGLNLIPAGRVTAQTFTTLHSFTGVSDGDAPGAGLILSGNTLYGTAEGGGSSGDGTVFAVSTDGTGFTTLHSFAGYPSDGSAPSADLILSGSTLYGTAPKSGSSGNGTMFAVNTDGTSFTNLYNFTAISGSLGTNSDGSAPSADLILSGNTLYGTARNGGRWGQGTVFAVNTNGTGFTTLYSFSISDGKGPTAGLVLSGNTLYGTTYLGGSSLFGTVFAINTDGTSFTTLHNFTEPSGSLGTNNDGAMPMAGLVLSGDILYGTALLGGTAGNGTVFAVNTNGMGFTNLHNFTATSTNSFGDHPNSDGAGPVAGLVLSGNTLYGTARFGGSSGLGTAFAVHTDGNGFTNLHSFTEVFGSLSTNSDGGGPLGRLVLSDNTLYGTAVGGGSPGGGTVFAITVDATAPTIAFSPLTNDQVVFNFDQLGGTVSETSTVQFTIEWYYGNQFWNGVNWTSGANDPGVLLPASLSGLNWTPAPGTLPPRLQLAPTTYVIHVYATDTAGNGGQNSLFVTRSAHDTSPPSVYMDSTSIQPNEVITNRFLPPVFGVAYDPESGVASVTVLLARSTGSGLLYWDGANWTATPTNLPAVYTANDSSWHLYVALPSGANLPNATYSMDVSAVNNEVPAGGSVSVPVNFSVDYHPVFVFTYGSQFGLTPNMRWDDPANWDVGSVPTSDARVVINGIYLSPDNTSLGSNLKLYRLDLSAGWLTTSGMLITNLNVSGGTLAGGVISLPTNGVFNWSGGYLSGTYLIPAGASFNLSGSAPKTLSVATINSLGSSTWTGTGDWNFQGGVFSNGASFTVLSDAQVNNNGGGVFINAASFTKSGTTGTNTFGVPFNNNGSLNVESGTLALYGGGAATNGTFSAADGGRIEFANGIYYMHGTSAFIGPGVTRVSSDAAHFAGAEVSFAGGPSTLSGGAIFELAGGVVVGSSVFGGAGMFNWTGGAIGDGNGPVTLSLGPSIALNLSGSNPKTLTLATLSSLGSSTWTGTGDWNLGGVFSNGAPFTVRTDAPINGEYGLFINGSSFTKSSTTGTNICGVAFNNNGSLNVQSGAVVLNLGGTGTNGTFSAAGGARIEFANGYFHLNGPSTFTGAGVTRVTGAAVVFGGGPSTLSGGAIFELAGGVVVGSSVFGGAGMFNWTGGAIGDGSGAVTLSLGPSIALNLSGSNPKTLSEATINSLGSNTWTGTGDWNFQGGVFSNGASFTVLSDAQVNNSGGGVFINAASFIKSGTTGTTTCGVAFTNNGLVDVRSGVLTLGGGYTPSPTSQLKLALGGLAAGTQFSQLNIGGAVGLAGTLGISLANNFTPTNGQSFAIVNDDLETGQFASQQLPALPGNLAWQVIYGATGVTLNVVGSTARIITDATRLANGHFQFSLSGPNASSAIIEGSTNLLDWTSLQTNTPFTSPLLFDDPQAIGFPIRFYRATIYP